MTARFSIWPRNSTRTASNTATRSVNVDLYRQQELKSWISQPLKRLQNQSHETAGLAIGREHPPAGESTLARVPGRESPNDTVAIYQATEMNDTHREVHGGIRKVRLVRVIRGR